MSLWVHEVHLSACECMWLYMLVSAWSAFQCMLVHGAYVSVCEYMRVHRVHKLHVSACEYMWVHGSSRSAWSACECMWVYIECMWVHGLHLSTCEYMWVHVSAWSTCEITKCMDCIWVHVNACECMWVHEVHWVHVSEYVWVSIQSCCLGGRQCQESLDKMTGQISIIIKVFGQWMVLPGYMKRGSRKTPKTHKCT